MLCSDLLQPLAQSPQLDVPWALSVNQSCQINDHRNLSGFQTQHGSGRFHADLHGKTLCKAVEPDPRRWITFVVGLAIGLEAHQSVGSRRGYVPSVAPFGIGHGVNALIDQGLIEAIAAQAFPCELVVTALHTEFSKVKLPPGFFERL